MKVARYIRTMWGNSRSAQWINMAFEILSAPGALYGPSQEIAQQICTLVTSANSNFGMVLNPYILHLCSFEPREKCLSQDLAFTLIQLHL